MTLPVNPQAALAAALVDEWVRAGLAEAVVAPGSRSTPLALALADDGRLRIHVVLDERSAGFMALGIGLASGRPAPVVTTSGSAPAHLLPAVIEAHHARVPMIVCSADRPAELHDVGAPQTTGQLRLYEGCLRWQADPGADLPRSAWRSLAARSVVEATSGPAGPGPVQLNLAFRDPLVASPGDLVPEGRSGDRPWHIVGGRATATVPITTGATSTLSGRAGVIMAGAGIVDPGPVLELARSLGWPVLADPRSRCRNVPGQKGTVVVSAFDGILRCGEAAARLRPEAVLRLGAAPASKVTGAWLAEEPSEQVAADPFGAWIDPDRTAALVVRAEPEAACRSILANGPAPGPDGWAAAWRTAESAAQRAIDDVLARRADLTEPAVARTVTATLGEGSTLLVASSMPVRDVEWFGSPVSAGRVVANRGVNGIDGMVSTALGVAAGSRGPTVALLGDLAFLHDSGGLLGARGRGLDCTFVVMDNDGGGIFSFLPPAELLAPERFEQLFGTPHGIDLGALAAVHGIPVECPRTVAELTQVLGAGEKGVRLVLVRSDRATNVAVHDELNRAIASAVEA